MAGTVYYGKSNTVNNGTYQVIVEGLDATITQESDFLSSGDILNVFFSRGCEVSHPALKLFNGDIEHEISITPDTGHYIRIQSTDVNLTGVWTAGQLCSFVYVKEAGNTTYWHLSGVSFATTDNYGQVKITSELDDNTDGNLIATAGAVRALVEQGEASELSYLTPYTNLDSSNIYIGTLKLLNPRGQESPNSIEVYIPNTDTFKVRTSELINDGPMPIASGETANESNIGQGHPFLTRIIPGSLTFTDSFSGNTTKGLTLLDNNGNETVIYELADASNNSKIRSKGNISLIVGTNNQITLSGITEITRKLTLDKKLYFVLDVAINQNTNQATSGSDKKLYNNLLLLGWDDCIIQ